MLAVHNIIKKIDENFGDVNNDVARRVFDLNERKLKINVVKDLLYKNGMKHCLLD